jgi:hypothetical protein
MLDAQRQHRHVCILPVEQSGHCGAINAQLTGGFADLQAQGWQAVIPQSEAGWGIERLSQRRLDGDAHNPLGWFRRF